MTNELKELERALLDAQKCMPCRIREKYYGPLLHWVQKQG